MSYKISKGTNIYWFKTTGYIYIERSEELSQEQ